MGGMRELRMEKVDKTKKNINVTNLDDKTKKELFDKFVSAGGKVVREDRRQGMTDYDRELQKKYNARLAAHKKTLNTPSRTKTAPAAMAKKTIQPKKTARASAYRPAPTNPLTRFIDRWHIRFRLFFLGVTDLYGTTITSKYLEKFTTEYKSALVELQLVYLDVLKKNIRTGQAVTSELDRINPVLTELMEMSSDIFDRTVFNQIVEHHITFPHISQKSSEIRTPLMTLFKKLYVLYPHQDVTVHAFDKAIGLQMKIERGKSSLYSLKRKKIKNGVYILYNKLFKSLYWLFCLYEGRIFQPGDPEINTILGVTDDDIPGKRSKLRLSDAKSDEEKPAEEDVAEKESQEPEDISDHVKKGLQMLSQLDLTVLKEQFDRSNYYKFVRDTDKIFIAHLLFREFDEEYSFIFTTNKIKYNVIFAREGKIDYRLGLSDLYNELRQCGNLFKDYADILENYEKIRLEKPTGNAQYIEYTNRLNAIEKKRNNTGKDVRMKVRGFMDKCSTELKKLIDDMNGSQTIIGNPQDVLRFESAIEGNRKMNDKKVYEIITYAYWYSSAFAYRLGPSGDLYGGLEFSGKEGKNSEIEAQGKKDQPTAPGALEPEKKTGVIDELEDLF